MWVRTDDDGKEKYNGRDIGDVGVEFKTERATKSRQDETPSTGSGLLSTLGD